jgi:glycerol kinase
MKYILAIDQSTAGTKGIIIGTDGRIISRQDISHRQITNDKGWIEHDPMEIFENVLRVSKLTVEKAGITTEELTAVGISNQRETVVAWDRKTGKPVCNAVVWQCGRAADIAAELEPYAEEIRTITGLQLSPYFSGQKMAWILRNVPRASELASEGRLAFGTIDAWLVYKLTDGKSFKTDYSNASRTMLLDLNSMTWSARVAGLLGIDVSMLPEICMSDADFGNTTVGGLCQNAIPIHGVLGDSHAALYANDCREPYTAKATFGTGTSVMMNAGTTRPADRAAALGMEISQGVVESVAWAKSGTINYAIEGNINYSGAIIKWMTDKIGLMVSSKESGPLAESVPDNGGVYLVPAFSGLGAPYWASGINAMICGMKTSTTKAHIVRAGEEAIAYQIRDIVEEINASDEWELSSLAVDGGAIRDRFLMNFVCGMLNVPLRISEVEELSAVGAGYMAAIGCGAAKEETLFASVSHRMLQPAMASEERDKFYAGWKNAVNMLIEKENK